MHFQLPTLFTLAILSLSAAIPLRSTPRETTIALLSPRDGGDTDPVMTDTTGAIVPFDAAHVVAKKDRRDLMPKRDGGDTDPVMTDTTGTVVPFDASHVVAKGRRDVVVVQQDSDPVMTDTTGAVVPFDASHVVT